MFKLSFLRSRVMRFTASAQICIGTSGYLLLGNNDKVVKVQTEQRQIYFLFTFPLQYRYLAIPRL